MQIQHKLESKSRLELFEDCARLTYIVLWFICCTFDRCWRNCWFKINRLFELKYLNTSTILAKIIEHACFVILNLYHSLRRTIFQLASYSLFTMKSVLFTRFYWHLFIKIYRINMPIDERLMYLSSECSLRDNIGSCSSWISQSN